MASLSLSDFDPALKDHYSQLGIQHLYYQENQALGMLSKNGQKRTDVGGKKWVQPFSFALPGGGSSTFATAIASAANTSLYEAWEVTRAKHYRLAKVDGETIEASATGNMDAFEPAFNEFDKAMEAESNWINFRFFRSKGGASGRLANTTVTTTVATLSDAADTWGWRKTEVAKGGPNADGTSLRTGSLTVASVDRDLGTITFTANIDTGLTTPGLTDYLFLDGDATLGPAGLADWVPDAAPASTAFFGVDRTVDIAMMGGLRITAGHQSLANLLIQAVAKIQNLNGKPNVIWMNPITFGTLSNQIEGKWVSTSPTNMKGEKIATIGYSGFQVNLNGQMVTIYQDNCCPRKRVYVLTWKTWMMFSAGSAPKFLQERAGSIIKVSESSDGYEARVGEYMNFCCTAPGHNCVIILS